MKESFEASSSSSSSDHDWFLLGGLYLNPHFFKRGILLISPDLEHQKHVSQERKSFQINDREFMFHTEGGSKKTLHQPPARGIKKAKSLLGSLMDFANSNHFEIRTPREKSRILFNRYRKDEVFLPVLFGNETNSTGLYLYPWTAKPGTVSFSGFNQFVTAGCMFGAAIKGITDNGESIELINHRLNLQAEQKITSIFYDIETKNPFEDMLFNEFQTNCFLIKAMTAPDQRPNLLYHLPDIDYIMFGIKLFIRQQMSYEALDKFINAVLIQRELHQKILGDICLLHNIAVTFDSPFYNLLPHIDLEHPTLSIIDRLGIDIQNLTNTHTQEENERQFTKSCLLKLMSSDHNIKHARAWQDFINAKPQQPETIEELFKIGNAVMIAAASKGQEDYKTCSLLPLSEKQIQLMYEQCRNKYNALYPEEHSPYPASINLTLFEPVITYSPTTKGLLFYFACYLASVSSLITEKKLVYHAARNLSFFADKTTRNGEVPDRYERLTPKLIELQDLLSESTSTRPNQK